MKHIPGAPFASDDEGEEQEEDKEETGSDEPIVPFTTKKSKNKRKKKRKRERKGKAKSPAGKKRKKEPMSPSSSPSPSRSSESPSPYRAEARGSALRSPTPIEDILPQKSFSPRAGSSEEEEEAARVVSSPGVQGGIKIRVNPPPKAPLLPTKVDDVLAELEEANKEYHMKRARNFDGMKKQDPVAEARERPSFAPLSSAFPIVKTHHSTSSGFCEDCKIPFQEHEAYKHYSGKLHYDMTKNKIRCYLCSKHVDYTKSHLENYHSKDVFKCLVSGCSNPKFVMYEKLDDHLIERHSSMVKHRSVDSLVRSNLISVPVNLASYKCRVCNRAFVGQNLDKIYTHLRHEDNVAKPNSRDIQFYCRICGTHKPHESDSALQVHLDMHLRAQTDRRSRSRDSSSDRSRKSSQSRRSSRRYSSSSSRSRSRSPRTRQRKKDYVRCTMCPQVTEKSKDDKRRHQQEEHSEHFFKCSICRSWNAASIEIDDVLDHVYERHHKRKGSNEALNCIIYPKDKRSIFCNLCKSWEGERREWNCQALRDVEEELEEHLTDIHGGGITRGKDRLLDVIGLGCRACDKTFDYSEDYEWREHVKSCSKIENMASHSRSRSPPREVDNASDAYEDHHSASMSSRSRHCPYCVDGPPSGKSFSQHIRECGRDNAFICSLCPKYKEFAFEDHVKLRNHVRHCHPREPGGENWRRRPRSFVAFRCIPCRKVFHGMAEKAMKRHFNYEHKDMLEGSIDDFPYHLHLDYQCRMCMKENANEDLEELLHHLESFHRYRDPYRPADSHTRRASTPSEVR